MIGTRNGSSAAAGETVKTTSRVLVLLALAVLLMPVTRAATSSDDAPRRFSIAISGGASLGAYEAGLGWGVLHAIRVFEHQGDVAGGRIRQLEAASFAGASAGGINAVLSAMTWCVRPESEGGFPNRIDDNVFRNLWMLPDVNNLLPPRPDSPLYVEGDALLSRSSLREAGDQLAARWAMPAYRSGCRAPVALTFTRVVPERLTVNDVEVRNQRFYTAFELRTQKDGRAGFFFDPADYPSLQDPSLILLPREKGAPAHSISPQLVLESVYTTSSVPVGFGRRKVTHCRTQSGVVNRAPEEDAAAPGIAEAALNCPAGYELAEAEFADGGLFDNLPLGVARSLAERDRHTAGEPLPVMYMYLDPDRTRFPVPKGDSSRACEQPNPPAACSKLDYGIGSESELLLGAIGSARKYELYRELTGDSWDASMPALAAKAVIALAERGRQPDCRDLLPFFAGTPDCITRLRHTSRMLELSYGHETVAVRVPFSVERLQQAGIATGCMRDGQAGSVCRLNTERLREVLADALITALRRAGRANDPLIARAQRARFEMRDDRSLRVSSRGAPVTGSLLGAFGAFLDRKFREYDYYVGVYDALVSISDTVCRMQYSLDRRSPDYPGCVNRVAKRVYDKLGVANDARGRYTLALLARAEFGSAGQLTFAYEPMPAEDHDMRLVHEALAKTLAVGTRSDDSQGFFHVEETFFRYLRTEGFKATPVPDGSKPLLAQIMANPDYWSSEAVQRFTERLVLLEEDARDIFRAREPDPEKREEAMVGLLGATSHILRSSTYNLPSFTFAPSTAPDRWFARNLIPYELAFDMVDGDMMLTWQPTWSLGRSAALSVRGTIGLAGGLIDAGSAADRKNYLLLGPDLTWSTGHQLWSSWGAMAGWYHTFQSPATGKQDAPAFDVHVGLFKDRIRLGIGARDANDIGDNWFLSLGIADLPGLIYWLTR